MTDYRLGSKYIMIRCDYCNKKLAFIDGNRDAIHDIMCIGCSNLRRP
jgi:phage FluMu protein Com